jgi:hypothetical protein
LSREREVQVVAAECLARDLEQPGDIRSSIEHVALRPQIPARAAAVTSRAMRDIRRNTDFDDGGVRPA